MTRLNLNLWDQLLLRRLSLKQIFRTSPASNQPNNAEASAEESASWSSDRMTISMGLLAVTWQLLACLRSTRFFGYITQILIVSGPSGTTLAARIPTIQSGPTMSFKVILWTQT